MGIFLLGWLLFTMVLTQKKEKTINTKQISIEAGTKRCIYLFKFYIVICATNFSIIMFRFYAIRITQLRSIDSNFGRNIHFTEFETLQPLFIVIFARCLFEGCKPKFIQIIL